MSFVKSVRNGTFLLYEKAGAYSDYGRPIHTGTIGTVKYICRYTLSGDLSRQMPEIGNQKGMEILCHSKCPAVVDDLLKVTNRLGEDIGDYRVVSVDEGEFLTSREVKRLLVVFQATNPELEES